MIKVFTTKSKSKGENGNCLAASLASVLEIQIEEVPEFENMTKDTWKNALFEWASKCGYAVRFTKNPPVGFAIGVGIHPEGEFHAVVVLNGEFFFDPNGSDEFYETHRYYIDAFHTDPSMQIPPYFESDNVSFNPVFDVITA